MKMNETIEAFYINVLSFAGMGYDPEEHVIKHADSGEPFEIEGKQVALPYQEVLRNPNGKVIFHPLNEDYLKPNNATIDTFRLAIESYLNKRLGSLLINITAIATEAKLQKFIKNEEMIDIIANLGEVDGSMFDLLVKVYRWGSEVHGPRVGFKLHLKKDGTLNDEVKTAIGKYEWTIYKEVMSNFGTGEYTHYGHKIRKKDSIFLRSLLEGVIPNIEDESMWTESVTNKTFRWLSVILKTSYMLASRINELEEKFNMLSDELIKIEEPINLDWAQPMGDLFGMITEIRKIPNQTNVVSEAKRLKLDESAGENVTSAQPAYTPPAQTNQPAQTPQAQHPQQPQQPASVLDYLSGARVPQQQMPYPQQQMSYPQQQMGGYPYQQGYMGANPRQNMPGWMIEEERKRLMETQGGVPNSPYPQQMPYQQQMSYPQQQMGGYPYQQPPQQQQAGRPSHALWDSSPGLAYPQHYFR